MASHWIHYLTLIGFGLLALVIACTPLLIAKVLSPHKPSELKQATYECGLEATGGRVGKVQNAILPLRAGICHLRHRGGLHLPLGNRLHRTSDFGGFVAMSVFILIMAESLVYLWLKGFLEWK